MMPFYFQSRLSKIHELHEYFSSPRYHQNATRYIPIPRGVFASPYLSPVFLPNDELFRLTLLPISIPYKRNPQYIYRWDAAAKKENPSSVCCEAIWSTFLFQLECPPS